MEELPNCLRLECGSSVFLPFFIVITASSVSLSTCGPEAKAMVTDEHMNVLLTIETTTVSIDHPICST
jgi:hypothetical protein